MRILKIVPQAFYVPRGTPLSAYHRARELIARGHEVDILTYGVGGPAPPIGARILRARGPHFARQIDPGPSRLKIWFDLLLFVNLLARLRRERYDLLYAHEEGALLARIAGALHGIPYVYDMHSSLPLQITDWKFSRSRSVIALFRWVERVCVKGACAVVAISPAVARAALRAVPQARCVLLANHFELPADVPAEAVAAVRARHGIDPDEKLVLYTGSFVALQALDLLLDAAVRVCRAMPRVRFLLIGGQPAEIESLAALAARLGIADRVLLDGMHPQSEVPAYLAAADVLVSPRVQGINPPGKLLSYLAAGRPVVATNTLVHNQILDEHCAILTAPDPAGLADGILLALTDPERNARMRVEGERLLRRYGSPAARDAAYAEILRAALAATPRPVLRMPRLRPRDRSA